MTLGTRIRKARLAAGISQANLADLMGITRSACSQWESDHGTAPRRDRLERLAKLLGVSYVWLATGEGGASGSRVREPAAGYLSVEQEELLRLFKALPPKRRAALLVFLRSF